MSFIKVNTFVFTHTSLFNITREIYPYPMKAVHSLRNNQYITYIPLHLHVGRFSFLHKVTQYCLKFEIL